VIFRHAQIEHAFFYWKKGQPKLLDFLQTV
jgi:hypothetical protein